MSFQDLNLIEPLQQAILKEKYTTPTPIQKQAIPVILDGIDLLGIAQTGTGKTAAFVLPILQLIANNPKKLFRGSPRVLVLAPTRELAAQIEESFSTYGSFVKFRHTAIFGGVGQSPQVKALNRGIDVLVATPGRLLDLINQGYIKLGRLEFFVLDEADRMLDMGFIHDIRKIIKLLPEKRHSLFFSATMSSNVSKLANSLLVNPKRVEVTPQATTVDSVEQKVFFVDKKKKDDLLLTLLKKDKMSSVLVFTRTKHRANKIAKRLITKGIKANAIHGDKSQTKRVNALKSFKLGHSRVLVATDIAARGIDIDHISHVVNYDVPNESEAYVHRIGRTARAGASGSAYSFCASDERNYLRKIEKLIKRKIKMVDHCYHSETAKNAVGNAAKPPPRRPRGPKSRKKTKWPKKHPFKL